MVTSEQKEIANQSMRYALDKGCDQVRISVITGENNSLEYRNGILDKLQKSSEAKLFIELFTHKKYGSFSTNRLNTSEIKNLIAQGISSVNFLSEDECRCLPDLGRYYKSKNQTNLNLFDQSLQTISIETKKKWALQINRELENENEPIVSLSSSYDDTCESEYMIDNQGFEGESSNSYVTLVSEVALKTDSAARAEGFWYETSIFANELVKQGISQKALIRAKRKIGQTKIASGKYKLLIDNTVSAQLLSPIISAMYGSALQQKNSFLIGKSGKKIASASFTLADTPHIEKGFGSRWFDDEGVATQNAQLIENGILNSFFIDTYNSKKLAIQPTISSPSILSVTKGSRDFAGLLTDMSNGIWVTGFNGGNTNSATGDFSFGIEGFLIKNGVAVTPISEMNITGNMIELWHSLLEAGNDPRPNSSWQIPSLLFDTVNFSGL